MLSPIPVGLSGIGPSDLGECALVWCCSGEPTLDLWAWIAMFWGLKRLFLETYCVSKSYDFFTALVFADFQNLKIWVHPNPPFCKGLSKKIIFWVVWQRFRESSYIWSFLYCSSVTSPGNFFSMSLVCDMETVICGICLVNYCFQFSDMLKRVLNLVSLESDLSVSEAYISQLLGLKPPHPTGSPFRSAQSPSSTQDLQRSRLGI